jgi:hypothetical protein
MWLLAMVELLSGFQFLIGSCKDPIISDVIFCDYGNDELMIG